MTRKEAIQIALIEIDKEIAKHGEDAIAMAAPKPGKNSWTWAEYKNAIINDECLEGTNMNPIDGILNLHNFLSENKQ